MSQRPGASAYLPLALAVAAVSGGAAVLAALALVVAGTAR